MKCPYCDFDTSKVVDSRPIEEGNSIRRRRECENCKKRFTTYEKIEQVNVMVVKKDGAREFFDREKILKGIIRSCEKRPISIKQMENIVTDIENNEYTIKIFDNAGGIQEDVMDKIFEPYFTTKINRKASGLGLFISKIIIEENMQGKLEFENANEGAKFIIKIPILEEIK